jgi:hypothetical protein
MERPRWKDATGHLGPADGKRGLSEYESLQKARKMKAGDLGIIVNCTNYYNENYLI